LLVETLLKFSGVGIINTILDFGLFNLLSGKRLHVDKIVANITSTTIAMVFSFFANQQFVFRARGGSFWVQAAEFFVVMAFGLYVLQSITIHLIITKFKFITSIALRVASLLGLRKRLSDDFIIRNTAKLAATAVSLVWSFTMLQYVVFRP
jgi:putative flippase GtrA